MIVFILPNFSGGGAERVALNIFLQLHNKGYPLKLVVFSNKGNLISMIPSGVNLINLKTNSLRRSIFPLLKVIYKIRPSVIFSTFGYVNLALLAFRSFMPRNIKIWAREANFPLESTKNNSYQKVIRFGYRYLYSKLDLLICSSEKMRNEFVLNFSIDKSITRILPNPVNESFIHSKIVPMQPREDDNILFIASGRLTYQKGFDRLIEWFSHLNNKFSLMILGEGPLKDDLLQQIKSLGLSDRISLLGFRSNPWALYAAADCFLLPSRWEGMPNAVLESLACGTPVIVTKESGGVSEILEHVDSSAVKIVDTGDYFITEMSKIRRKERITNNFSLLPDIYKVDKAITIFEKWLDEIDVRSKNSI
jgi:glycosyltransferase involved in cell wall biosynthesis